MSSKVIMIKGEMYIHHKDHVEIEKQLSHTKARLAEARKLLSYSVGNIEHAVYHADISLIDRRITLKVDSFLANQDTE